MSGTMNEQTVRFRLGIFVLASLILLGVLIILFGGTPTALQVFDRYTIIFDSAAGISAGTPVRKSGVKIGEVESVRLDDETGKVYVTIRIEQKYKIHKTEQATVVQPPLGDTTIDFVPVPPSTAQPKGPGPGAAAPAQLQLVGAALMAQAPVQPPELPIVLVQAKDKQVVPPGSTIPGKSQPGTAELMQRANKVLAPTEEAMKEAMKFFRQANKMTPLMEETLKEYRELAKQTRQLAPGIEETNKELRELIKTTRATVPDLKRTNEEIQVTSRTWTKLGERLSVLVQTNEKQMVKALEQLNRVLSDDNVKNLTDTLKNAGEASKQLDSIARNTDALLRDSRKTIIRVNDSVERADQVLKNLEETTKPMAERSGRIFKNLDEATAELTKVMTDVRALTGIVGRTEGTLSKLLTDPSLYNRLDEAACAVNRTLPRLDRILRDVEVFADRIARHPELIGVGGAINPSNGLKDLPLRPTWPH
jgi:ABC-type transporter Mla subunit MlaD